MNGVIFPVALVVYTAGVFVSVYFCVDWQWRKRRSEVDRSFLYPDEYPRGVVWRASVASWAWPVGLPLMWWRYRR